jgi:phosphoglycerate dehydrogenase-like enzyme
MEVAVLRQKVHGRPASDYAGVIREQFGEHGVDADVTLARTPEEERAALARADVATGIGFDESWLDEATVALFACVYAGTDHLPLDALAKRGVAVTNASGVHGPNIAEFVVGAVLAFVREFWTARRHQRARRWESFNAGELAGSTVTVVGQGAIGQTVVERFDAFDVETLAVRWSPEKGGPADETVGYDRLHEALARTDHLVVACPLTDDTRGLVDEDALATLPTHATLTNVARGPVVDTDALVEALRDDHVRGAALDVTDPEPLPEDHPLWGFDEVLITPHNAGDTPRYYERRAGILARNLARVAETGAFVDLENQVR